MEQPNLTSPGVLKQLLFNHNIRLSKRYGQNFLCDANIVRRIAEAVPDGIRILEIGPGVGTLTLALANRASKLAAVEIDERLMPLLKRHLELFQNVSVIHSDILKLDFERLSDALGPSFSVVGNLPYQITSPLLGRVIEHRHLISECVFMVQRELADKILSPVGSGKGSALGVFVNAFADAERLFHVPRTVFFPRPQVDSTLFRLKFVEHPKFSADEAVFFSVVRAAFNLRRKTIRQALMQSPLGQIDPRQVEGALERADIDPRRRGETLTLGEFDRLALSLA